MVHRMDIQHQELAKAAGLAAQLQQPAANLKAERRSELQNASHEVRHSYGLS